MKTNRDAFFEEHNIPKEKSLSLSEIAKLSGMPEKALQKVYQKGLGAYHTNPLSVRLKGSFKKNVDAPMSMKLSPQQWGFARVYAFVMKRPSVFKIADRHIAEEFNLL